MSITENICKCPCYEDGKIVAKKNFYVCSNRQEGCGFALPRTMNGVEITTAHLRTLVSGGQTEPMEFSPRDRKPYMARLTEKAARSLDGRRKFVLTLLFSD